MDDADILAAAERKLQELASRRPWMTARGLARSIEVKFAPGSGPVDPVRLESLLERNYSPRGEIRYSYYPSARTLEPLWGHVDNVGRRRSLPPLHRVDGPTHDGTEPAAESLERLLHDERPWCFLSHNHDDAEPVQSVRTWLDDNHVGSWMFETDIDQGENIAHTVHRALARCNAVVGYLSYWALGSVWVRKEMGEEGREDAQVRLIVDGTDGALISLLAAPSSDPAIQKEQVRRYATVRSEKLGATLSARRLERMIEFVKRLDETMGGDRRPPLIRPGRTDERYAAPSDWLRMDDLKEDGVHDWLGVSS